MVALSTLVRAGGDVNAQSLSGESPLTLAVRKDHGDGCWLVTILLQAGADLGPCTRAGVTAIIAATMARNYQALAKLVLAADERAKGSALAVRRELVHRSTRPFGSVHCYSHSPLAWLLQQS